MPAILGTSKSLSAFTPQSIPGVSLWLDAADASTFTFSSGTSITQWRDKVSGIYASNTAGTGSQPVYSAASQNGLGTVYYDASTALRYLDIPAFSWGTTSRSCFFVMKNIASATNSGSVLGGYPHWFWDRVNGNNGNTNVNFNPNGTLNLNAKYVGQSNINYLTD